MKTHSRLGIAPALPLAIMLLLSLIISCSHRRSEADIQAISSVLKKQADAWDQAILRKDLNAISDNMSVDFRHISKTGGMSDKATFLREIVSPDLVIHPYAVEDFDIRIYGNCALLCGRTRMTGIYQGKPFQSHYRYVDTYTRNNGKWMVCNVQISGIPE